MRWNCPNGCAFVLASSRPRKDSVSRYCLACSERTGYLVPRTAKVLEAAREARLERRRALSYAEQEREQTQVLEHFTVAGHDMRELLRVAWSLPTAIEWRERRSGLARQRPTMRVRWCTQIKNRLGTAWPASHRISLSVTKDMSIPPVETLLHEVAHILVGYHDEERWHGAHFKACLARLRNDWEMTVGPSLLVGSRYLANNLPPRSALKEEGS